MSVRALAVLTFLVVACGGGAAPAAGPVAEAVVGMAAWAADPLVAAAEQAPTCATIGELSARHPRPTGSMPATGVAAALAHFAASCQAYGRTLATYPIDQVRRERAWHESLKEGVMVASDYWRDETVASEARLAALQRRWLDATRDAERERALGCAALAALELPPGYLTRACP
jgi:hypothetical protein